jgi:hypothetical protein
MSPVPPTSCDQLFRRSGIRLTRLYLYHLPDEECVYHLLAAAVLLDLLGVRLPISWPKTLSCSGNVCRAWGSDRLWTIGLVADQIQHHRCTLSASTHRVDVDEYNVHHGLDRTRHRRGLRGCFCRKTPLRDLGFSNKRAGAPRLRHTLQRPHWILMSTWIAF